MSEFELEGLASKGQSNQLVTKTDAEYRPFAYLIPDGSNCVSDGSRVARSVAQAEPVRLKSVYGLAVHICRHKEDCASFLFQGSKYIQFHPEIHGHYTP